jgi:hypothetical protein
LQNIHLDPFASITPVNRTQKNFHNTHREKNNFYKISKHSKNGSASQIASHNVSKMPMGDQIILERETERGSKSFYGGNSQIYSARGNSESKNFDIQEWLQVKYNSSMDSWQFRENERKFDQQGPREVESQFSSRNYLRNRRARLNKQ